MSELVDMNSAATVLKVCVESEGKSVWGCEGGQVGVGAVKAVKGREVGMGAVKGKNFQEYGKVSQLCTGILRVISMYTAHGAQFPGVLPTVGYY